MAEPNTEYTPQVSSKPTLADLLTIENKASIFYAYARELELSQGLSQKEMKMTLFVPTNKAVMNLARKPHQGSKLADENISISEQEYDQISKANVERWVSAHIVPGAPIPLTGSQQTLLTSKSITFKPIAKAKNPDWTQVTLEDGIHIISKKEASNGDLYMIDGAIVSDASTLD
ncbi:hypothetical protein CC1G_00702 [Coprinopsis cinerea okayama7|uniref:FAS1 domain-containing protein n=1 Tax=Coprinopsis cinerea (strain Okayama-7 / 130 / ATCC MYA-4618 / FGSC 9003) TaxID=240176 RepID=A8N3Q7_COPC7|nr:hypothetical protein CC1G_00702 [Coprinopsis cinerea okayama7\|eukprot:XP_001829523.1 hypothetical protein CC1G_00702 [Coprinopsis cinerea okayama7\